jgi:hypothetical protein
MFEDVVPAIASALSAGGSELIVAGGKSALKSLYDSVRVRFGQRTPEAESLDAALQSPGEPARVEALAEALMRVMNRDSEFARHTLVAWQAVSAVGSAEDSAVVNNFSGQAEQVVQARTIRGGIKF